MVLIYSAQLCSSNPLWLLLCGNLANRDPSSHTSQRSDSLSGTMLFHSPTRTPKSETLPEPQLFTQTV